MGKSWDAEDAEIELICVILCDFYTAVCKNIPDFLFESSALSGIRKPPKGQV